MASNARVALAALLLGLPGLVLPQALVQAPIQAQAPVQGAAAAPQPAGEGSSQERPGPRVNDFPTLARVEYVYECMQENAGPPMQEMFYKCVCAADAVAARVSYDRWVELSVFNAARPMAGERGAYLRERKDSPALLRAYRELQASARKTCFIAPLETR